MLQECEDLKGNIQTNSSIGPDDMKGHRESASNVFVLLILAITTTFLMADQNILAPNLTAAGNEFGFTPAERDAKLGGQVALAFFLFGAPASVFIGYLADKMNRINLMVIVVFLGEIPCFCTIFVTQFWHLLLLRALTGVAVGGALPLMYSLLGDLFPVEKRTLASVLIAVSSGAGILFGQVTAGIVGPLYGWRIPFACVALPSMICVVLLKCCVKEPKRGAMEKELSKLKNESEEKITKEKFIKLSQVKTNILVFCQAFPGTVPWGFLDVFLNDFLAQDKGFGVHVATFCLLSFGVGCIMGVVVGGSLGQWLYNHNHKKLFCVFMSLSMILATLPFMYIIQADYSILTLNILAGFLGLFASVTPPNVRTVVINVNLPETRGTAFSLYNLADELGKGLGPVFVALLVGQFDRYTAGVVAAGFWYISAVSLFLLGFTIEFDEDILHETLLRRAEKESKQNRVRDHIIDITKLTEKHGVVLSPSHAAAAATTASSSDAGVDVDVGIDLGIDVGKESNNNIDNNIITSPNNTFLGGGITSPKVMDCYNEELTKSTTPKGNLNCEVDDLEVNEGPVETSEITVESRSSSQNSNDINIINNNVIV